MRRFNGTKLLLSKSDVEQIVMDWLKHSTLVCKDRPILITAGQIVSAKHTRGGVIIQMLEGEFPKPQEQKP